MKKLFIFFEEFLLAGSVLGDETGPQLFPIINSIEVITAVVSLTEHRGYNIEVEPTESFASQATAFFKGLANIFRSKGFFVSVHLYIDFKFEVITPTTDTPVSEGHALFSIILVEKFEQGYDIRLCHSCLLLKN